MNNKEKLDLMDKIARELEDLQNSQTSVLKKLSQIETDNINLGAAILEKKLPDLHEEVDSSVTIVTDIAEEFKAYREKFYVDNNMAATIDPTA
jgi:hypothetical protein